jgi:hypothetical protein
VTQAATSAAATATLNLRRKSAMEWILLEAGVALLLAVFIVWFTMGGKHASPPRASRPPADGDESAER